MNKFGKQKLNQPKSFNLKGITNEQRSESSPKANVWKSTLYYGALSILMLSTIGSVGLILETPEQKAARLKRQTEIQLAAEAQALELQKKTLDQEAEAQRIASMPKLKVDTWKCTNEYGFIQVSGSVRNMTDQPIDNLMIYGIFSTKNGEFVKDTSAMVEFLPLMPGQKSPFTALTSYNPAGSKCEIVFKEMFGGVVSHSD